MVPPDLWSRVDSAFMVILIVSIVTLLLIDRPALTKAGLKAEARTATIAGIVYIGVLGAAAVVRFLGS